MIITAARPYQMKGLSIDPDVVMTNIVYVDVTKSGSYLSQPKLDLTES